MLTIIVPPVAETHMWDEVKEVFYLKPAFKGGTLNLEHQLISLSRWEEKWCKLFLSSKKTNEELMDYVRCMSISNNRNDKIFDYLTQENYDQIVEYLDRPMTSTTLPREKIIVRKL